MQSLIVYRRYQTTNRTP